jgi:hypothetical protein
MLLLHIHGLHVPDIDLVAENVREHDLGEIFLALISVEIALCVFPLVSCCGAAIGGSRPSDRGDTAAPAHP